MVEKSDGSLWMWIQGLNCIAESFSYDGGHTCTLPRQSSKYFVPNSRFELGRLKSGSLPLLQNYKPKLPSPWWGGNNLIALLSRDDGEPWFDDFTVIPQSIHDEFAAAVKDNDKCVEQSLTFFYNKALTDSFKHQYAEYMRGLFEAGVPLTIGSDSHVDYLNYQEQVAKHIAPVGLTASDFSTPEFRKYD